MDPIKYEEYLTKLYNFAVCDLIEYTDKIHDMDIMHMIEDLNREDTKIYFVSLGVKMLLKLEIISCKNKTVKNLHTHKLFRP